MKSSKSRVDKFRAAQAELGLVPLRQTEIWCTPDQKKELQIKIAIVIAQVISKPA
jgi:hypothetical protein